MVVVKSEKPLDIPENYFDKRIFRIAIVLLVLLAIPAFLTDSFGTSFYFSCESEKGCTNPCYDCFHPNLITPPCEERFLTWCELHSDNNSMYISPGQILGDKPSKYYDLYYYILAFTIVLAFGLNHLFYTRRKRK